jgi:hypothetical protein
MNCGKSTAAVRNSLELAIARFAMMVQESQKSNQG